jgi:hypothetical protein
VLDSANGTLPIGLLFCPSDTGIYFASLIIKLDSGTRVVVLRGRATGKAPALNRLRIDNADIEFGDVLVDSCFSWKSVVENLDSIPVIVNGSIIGSSEFSEPTSMRIVSGGLDTVYFTFCPRDTGEEFAVDTLRDSAGRSSVALRLHGRGVAGILTVADTLRFTVNQSGCQTLPLNLKNDGNVPVRFAPPALAAPFSYVGVLPNNITLKPGDSTLLFVQFCDSVPDTISTTLHFSYLVMTGQTPSKLDSVVLVGMARRTVQPLVPLRLSRSAIFFGDVHIGDCVSDTFMIVNPNDSALAIDQSAIIPLAGAITPAFTVVLPDTFPVVIPKHDSIIITIRYCPRAGIPDSGSWRGRGEDSTLEVRLTGVPLPSLKSSGVRIWIDSVLDASVGTPFTLGVHVEPNPGETSNMTFDSVRIRYNARSLFTSAAIASDNSTHLPLRRSGNTITVVTNVHDLSAAGSGSFELEMHGLSTGEPVNVVQIDTAYFTGVPHDSLGIGIVLLSGCDLNGNTSFSKSGTIRALDQRAGSEQLSVTYRAPQGAASLLSMIDIRGRAVARRELEAGTGNDQRAEIDLSDIPPGFYLVELQVGSDRSTMQIMIMK